MVFEFRQILFVMNRRDESIVFSVCDEWMNDWIALFHPISILFCRIDATKNISPLRGGAFINNNNNDNVLFGIFPVYYWMWTWPYKNIVFDDVGPHIVLRDLRKPESC